MQLTPVQSVPVSELLRLFKVSFVSFSLIMQYSKAQQLNVGRSWKMLFWTKIKIQSLLFVMHINSNTLCKNHIIYKKLLCTVKLSKVYFFSLYNIRILYRLPTFTSFQCKSYFGAKIIGHLPEEGFNYVQLIRSDGTPPTQAPPSNSGCPEPSQLQAGTLRTIGLDMR